MIYNDNENLLTWETRAEFNTHSFEIKRSFDGIQFETIHNELASGKENGNTYHFIDAVDYESPVAYYQLVSVDEDGVKESFKIVAINRNYSNKNGVSLFPNPSNSNTNLKIESDSKVNCEIEVIDVKGMVISKESIILEIGSNSVDLKTENYSSGVYFVSIKGVSSEISKTPLKLVKL